MTHIPAYMIAYIPGQMFMHKDVHIAAYMDANTDAYISA